MSTKMEFVSKTQHYLKVKKPLLERQRRARMNKCLDTLKSLVAEFQGDDAILRMDKAEMLEATITFMRHQTASSGKNILARRHIETGPSEIESFRFGYMNAVNEVSRVMAATSGMNVEMGKAVMTKLGCEFNRMLQSQYPSQITQSQPSQPIETTDSKMGARSMSPASSGYHSDCEEHPSPMASPAEKPIWRPW